MHKQLWLVRWEEAVVGRSWGREAFALLDSFSELAFQ